MSKIKHAGILVVSTELLETWLNLQSEGISIKQVYQEPKDTTFGTFRIVLEGNSDKLPMVQEGYEIPLLGWETINELSKVQK